VSAKRRRKLRPTEPVRPLDGRETLLTVPEAADYLGVKERWMRAAIAERRIPFVKVGKLIRYRKSDLDTYIEGQIVPAGER
jgi:excisionase family DNA binding protein